MLGQIIEGDCFLREFRLCEGGCRSADGLSFDEVEELLCFKVDLLDWGFKLGHHFGHFNYFGYLEQKNYY